MAGCDYDFVVIGSGFGGAVSALRLSEKGYRVAVLEKGKAWPPERFPETNWNLRKFLWFPWLRCFGFQMLTFLKHVYILHGGGVGGGSLVYANQLLVPPDPVFRRPEWGEGDWKEKLAPHYDTAKKMLGANVSPQVGIADRHLREVGKEMRGTDTFHKNEVGIFFGTPDVTVPDPYFGGKGPDRTGCTFCGACMVGCRIGAKNTLDKNYLHLAKGLGARIFPETLVRSVRRDADGYRVDTRKTGNALSERQTFRARNVVFSGGVIGTVKLLLECRSNGHLPDISDRLGHAVRTNSETLLGVRSRDKKTDWNDQIAITSGVHVDETTHIEMVRYNKGSDLLLNLLTLMTDGGGNVPRILRYLINVLKNPGLFIKLLWPFGKAAVTSVLLVMQTDENHLKLVYKPRWWRLGRKGLTSELPEGQNRSPAYIPIANDVARRLSEKMDGDPLSSFPEVLMNCSTTAHILGGCCMGETPADGVVDRDGKLFNYPGLYVADGSVVPANLGVNPSLTITALSEYIMSRIPGKTEKKK